MVIFKDSVRVKVWTPVLHRILEVLLEIDGSFPWIPKELVITSINDSQHLPTSKHYKNEALDLRSKNFIDRSDRRHFRALLAEKLGPKFTVLFEGEGTPNEHFHVQAKKEISET